MMVALEDVDGGASAPRRAAAADAVDASKAHHDGAASGGDTTSAADGASGGGSAAAKPASGGFFSSMFSSFGGGANADDPLDQRQLTTHGGGNTAMDAETESILNHFMARLKTNKKADFLDALQEFKPTLDGIPLPERQVDRRQARKDTQREHVVLNGVQFIGDGDSKINNFISAVKGIGLSANMNADQAEDVSERVLQSTSRTSSGADAYFVLNELFSTSGDEQRLLKPRPGPLHPVQIELLYRNGTTMTCKVSTTNLFGLYRSDEIEEYTREYRPAEDRDRPPEPWVLLDTVVTENLTFTWGSGSEDVACEGTRALSLCSPEPAPVPHDETDELF